MNSRRLAATLLALALLTAATAALLLNRSSEPRQAPLSGRAKQYYQDHPTQFELPASREIRHILVKTEPRARALHRALRGKGERAFAAAATKHSTDRTTSTRGGALTLHRGETLPALERSAFTLKTGSISPPVRTSAGYHLVYAARDTQRRRTQPFEEVEGQIRARLQATAS